MQNAADLRINHIFYLFSQGIEVSLLLLFLLPQILETNVTLFEHMAVMVQKAT